MLLSDEPAVVIAETVTEVIAASSAHWGVLKVRVDEVNSILGVVAATQGSGGNFADVSRDLLRGHPLSGAPASTEGAWYRAPDGLHASHQWLRRVGGAIPTAEFAGYFPNWRTTGRGATLDLTLERNAQHPWAAWAVAPEGVIALPITVLRTDTADPIDELEGNWPIDELADAHVVVVGVGSIGSAAAHALAMAGVGRISLVDDDRLLWHNLVRHTSRRTQVGMFKVNTVADDIRARWPRTRVDPLRLNVITHADQLRPLIAAADVVLCAADGVAPRRVVSHLARRARTTAVLACVLLDGAVGEVLRLRPWPTHGCLLCQRAQLVADGVLDPEPLLDRAYGTGDRHRPMTAVGSDLQLVAQLAAKVTVATVLEARGHHDQSIRSEYAMLGLRPGTDTADVSAPFDLAAGELRWLPATPPVADCPTCRPCPPSS